MKLVIAIIIFSFAVGSTTFARSTEVAAGPALWRDLSEGDSATEVSKKLAAQKEIKSAKIIPGSQKKAPAIKVKMADGGIPVFGSVFSLSTEFDIPGRLINVTLASGDECASESVDKFDLISQALAGKYGPEKTGKSKLDSFSVSSALAKAGRSNEHEIISYGYANDSVAVILVLAFSKAQPPDYPYGANGFTKALYEIAKAAYDSQRSACHNSGDERVGYALRYMSRAAFDAQAAQIEKAADQKQKEANSNL